MANGIGLTGYTGVQAGFIKNPTEKAYLNTGVVFGGEANYKGTFLRGEAVAGTTAGAKLELGHTFDIDDTVGIEVSAFTQYNKSLSDKKSLHLGIEDTSGFLIQSGDKQYDIDIENSAGFDANWNKGMEKAGGKFKINFGGKKVKFGVGVEAGTMKSLAPDVTLQSGYKTTINNEQYQVSTTMNVTSKAEPYVTPTISADVKLGKHLSFNADASMYQGQAGIRYNF